MLLLVLVLRPGKSEDGFAPEVSIDGSRLHAAVMLQKQIILVLNYLKVGNFELTKCGLDIGLLKQVELDAEELEEDEVLLVLEYRAYALAPEVDFLHR